MLHFRSVYFYSLILSPFYLPLKPVTQKLAIEMLQPNQVMLYSEPYPFKQKHVASLHQQLLQTKILLLNDEMFSWYGSRALLMPPYLNELTKMANSEL